MKIRINTALLRYYMELKGYDKTKLADAAGLSRNTVSAVFSEKDVSMRTIQAIICALDIPSTKAGEIFFDTKLRIA